MQFVTGEMEERFCLVIDAGGNLFVRMSDAIDDTTVGNTIYSADMGIAPAVGWNLISVAVTYDATAGAEKTVGQAYVFNE